MEYRPAGRSGLKLSVLTLGLMVRDCQPGEPLESVRQTVRRAVELGVTTIDLATAYGGGQVERAVGRILAEDFAGQRDKLVIATKGAWADGSRKALIGNLERSLRQLGLDCVDVYYHHAPDEHVPAEETALALDQLVRQGKALYVGISNYSPAQTVRIARILRELGTPLALHQPNYNLLNRWIEDGLLHALDGLDMGAAVFAPLAQGLLSDASVEGPRPDSRAHGTLNAIAQGVLEGEGAYGRYPDTTAQDAQRVRAHVLETLRVLREIARGRGQTLSQLALAWVLRHPTVSTAIVGTSSVAQLEDSVEAVQGLGFTEDERRHIAAVLPPRWGMV